MSFVVKVPLVVTQVNLAACRRRSSKTLSENALVILEIEDTAVFVDTLLQVLKCTIDSAHQGL